jgi:hypothetical protein
MVTQSQVINLKQELKKSIQKRVSQQKALRFLIQPDNDYKAMWDVIITGVLLFSVAITPLQMALFDDLSFTW